MKVILPSLHHHLSQANMDPQILKSVVWGNVGQTLKKGHTLHCYWEASRSCRTQPPYSDQKEIAELEEQSSCALEQLRDLLSG